MCRRDEAMRTMEVAAFGDLKKCFPSCPPRRRAKETRRSNTLRRDASYAGTTVPRYEKRQWMRDSSQCRTSLPFSDGLPPKTRIRSKMRVAPSVQLSFFMSACGRRQLRLVSFQHQIKPIHRAVSATTGAIPSFVVIRRRADAGASTPSL